MVAGMFSGAWLGKLADVFKEHSAEVCILLIRAGVPNYAPWLAYMGHCYILTDP